MLEEMAGINKETVRKILIEELKKRKVRARFVPQCFRRIKNINALHCLLSLLK
jgi:hypothetical protein